MVLRPAVRRAFKPTVITACGAVGVPAAASSPLGALVWRPTLYRRNAVLFVSLRGWRRSSRRADIQASKQAKANVDAAVSPPARWPGRWPALFGSARELLVSAAPCGHSRRPDCFGKRLAIAAAMEAGASFLQFHADRFLSGASHPKPFMKLKALERIATADRAPLLSMILPPRDGTWRKA